PHVAVTKWCSPGCHPLTLVATLLSVPALSPAVKRRYCPVFTICRRLLAASGLESPTKDASACSSPFHCGCKQKEIVPASAPMLMFGNTAFESTSRSVVFLKATPAVTGGMLFPSSAGGWPVAGRSSFGLPPSVGGVRFLRSCGPPAGVVGRACTTS